MKKNVFYLIKRSSQIIRERGIVSFFAKTYLFVKNRISKSKEDDYPLSHIFADVLFINGCTLPHPSRYRVNHQMEQLFANGITCSKIFYQDLYLDLVKNYRLFVFYRCPWTEVIDQFISLAKENNKTVLFDIDDLVIDTKYTNKIKFVQTMEEGEKKNYDDGVKRIQKTLCLCEATITTTDQLACELKKYVPEVYINRNTASDQMVEISMQAIEQKNQIEHNNDNDKSVRIGYFSGSITHNDDIKMVLPVLERILSENQNVYLVFVGELDIPEDLKQFKNRIIVKPFDDWKKLPYTIASVDINIIPLENTIFNQAKSENKWTEASLVKVPTVASNIGALKNMIQNNETGILCSTNDEWYQALTRLIHSKSERTRLGEKSYRYVIKNCTTIYSGFPLAEYIKNKMNPNIAFILPSLKTSGGILVALKHCLVLKSKGYDVLIINEGENSENVIKDGKELFVISRKNVSFCGSFNKVVATLWSTVDFLLLYPNIEKRYYLVQGFETDFFKLGDFHRSYANQTYNISNIRYITISKWCKKWLENDFHKKADYAPNGLDIQLFQPEIRDFNGRIRILIEGNSNNYLKNVDESFKIAEQLDPRIYDIWYVSIEEQFKEWYRVDRFFHYVPYEDMPNIYQKSHILLKSSILESFSYPPLEMMATGGFAVVAMNEGNKEYLVNGDNCLLYTLGNVDEAINAITKITSDETLRKRLYEGGIKTARNRSWKIIEKDILKLYGLND